MVPTFCDRPGDLSKFGDGGREQSSPLQFRQGAQLDHEAIHLLLDPVTLAPPPPKVEIAIIVKC